MRSSLTVIKVGGSLFDWPELPRRLTELIDARKAADREERLVLIAGGGPAADMVRALDRIHGLGDQTAHRLALHAMDLTAIILAELLPGTVAVDHVDALRTVWSAGSIPVLAPRLTLDEIERSGQASLPASWDVTSDTIAAWIAVHARGGSTHLAQECSVARRHRSPGSRPTRDWSIRCCPSSLDHCPG